MKLTRRGAAFAAVALMALAPALASAQADWPQHPIKWVIPYSAGGTSDMLARLVGAKLSERLGQPVIIDNRAGASGNMGTDYVAKSAPDGYTIVLGNIGPLAVNRTLMKSLPYDPEKDLIPISLLMAYGNVIMVNNDVPVKSLKELIAMAKERSVPYAGNGVGTSLHLTGEFLAKRTGAKFTHVPYRSSPPGLSDTIAGSVPMAIAETAVSIPQLKAGKLRALAVSSPQRSAQLPDVPTVAEQGYPGFEMTGWVGVLVPKGTPEAITKRYVTEFTAIMNLPEIRHAVDDMAAYVPPLGPEYFAQYIRSETEKYRDLIKSANIKVEE